MSKTANMKSLTPEIFGVRPPAKPKNLEEKIWRKSPHDLHRYAAEKMVRYAGIFGGRRIAGRSGVGTVMASKNLKAVVIEADRTEELANPAEFSGLLKQQVKGLQRGYGLRAVP